MTTIYDRRISSGQSDGLVSVIIPIYNCEDYLRACLDGVLSQTYPNLEIILVDDGSTDGSYAICEEYAARNAGIVLLRKPNGGPSSARNHGLDHASGRYVAFIDADDSVDRCYIGYLVGLLRNEHADMASCGYDVTAPDGTVTSIEPFGKERFFPDGDMTDYAHFPYTVWHMMFTREIIGDTRFDERVFYMEDLKFIVEIFMKPGVIVNTSDALYHQIRHGESTTANRYAPSNFDRYFTMSKALEDMCDLSRGCAKLHSERLKYLIKEDAVMLALMDVKHVGDDSQRTYLRRSIAEKYKEAKRYPFGFKDRIVLWLCSWSPSLYRMIAQVDFGG